jgi:hypothetical protein
VNPNRGGSAISARNPGTQPAHRQDKTEQNLRLGAIGWPCAGIV